jgi:hypothetical protein
VLTLPDLFLRTVAVNLHGRSESIQVPVRLGAVASVVVADGHIVASSGDRPVFETYDAGGPRVRTVRFEAPHRAVTGRMKALAIQEELESFRSSGEPLPNRRQYEEQVIRRAPYSDSLPAIHSVHRTRSEVFWVVQGIGPGDAGWTAVGFRLTGELIGKLQSGIAGVPLAIDDSRVISRESLADGTSVIRVRAINPVNPR